MAVGEARPSTNFKQMKKVGTKKGGIPGSGISMRSYILTYCSSEENLTLYSQQHFCVLCVPARGQRVSEDAATKQSALSSLAVCGDRESNGGALKRLPPFSRKSSPRVDNPR